MSTWKEIPKEDIPKHLAIQIATFHYAQEDIQVFLVPHESPSGSEAWVSEQDELKKDFIEGLGENEYYDLSDLSDEQKKEFAQGFMTTVGKDFLKVFLGLALKTHMEAMIVDDASKKEFILSFKTVVEPPCSHERTYSNVDGFAYCDKCGIPMQ